MFQFIIIALCLTPIAFGAILYLIIKRAFATNEKIIKDLLIDNQYLRKDIAHITGRQMRTLLPSEERLIEDMERAEKKEKSPIIPLEEAVALGLLDADPKPRKKGDGLTQ